MVGKGLSLFLVAALLLPLLANCGDNVVAGIVDHKSVTGVIDGTAYTILVNRPGDGEPWISIEDSDYEDYFSVEDENAIVSESLENLMMQKYSEVSYFVNVRVSPEDEGTQPYRASREIFSGIEVGSEVKFRTSDGELPEIVELLEPRD